jgi:hypothetical protein
MDNLPLEIVEHIISFACCDRFVLVDESPVYRWALVEHPWGMGEGWYWIYDKPQGWWEYRDYCWDEDASDDED